MENKYCRFYWDIMGFLQKNKTEDKDFHKFSSPKDKNEWINCKTDREMGNQCIRYNLHNKQGKYGLKITRNG